jgi:hypothetical protein
MTRILLFKIKVLLIKMKLKYNSTRKMNKINFQITLIMIRLNNKLINMKVKIFRKIKQKVRLTI